MGKENPPTPSVLNVERGVIYWHRRNQNCMKTPCDGDHNDLLFLSLA